MTLHYEKLKTLEIKAQEMREDLIKMLIKAGSGHSAGPLGQADLWAALYFHVAKHDPKNPKWEDRDRIILDVGHCVPIRYVAMAHAGYFPKEELMTLRKIGSRIEGHPNILRLPALETSSGPLGEGLSQACGFALAARLRGKEFKYHIWCIGSDGEQDEGMIWEAAMFAAKYRLRNLTYIIDRNNIQIDGYTEDIMPLEPLRDKYEAFGWHVMEMNAHDMHEIVSTLEESKAIQEKPVLIIANTTPGKGIEFIENRYGWHGVPPGAGPEDVFPKEKQGEEALKALRTLRGQIESEYD